MTVHPLRVLIAEDNDDLRDLLVTLVSAEPDLRCVGTAQDVDAVIASTVEQKADVLVLDLELQGRSSIDVLKTVRKAGSKVIIIVFSGHSHPDMVRHTLAAGAGVAWMALPQWVKFEALRQLCGTEGALQFARASERVLDEIERFSLEHKIDSEFRRDGWLWGATASARREPGRAWSPHWRRSASIPSGR